MKPNHFRIALALAALPTFATGAITFDEFVDNDITNTSNWVDGTPNFGGTDVRWNIDGVTTYTAAQGTTTLQDGRSFAVGTGARVSALTISGGSLIADNSATAFIGDQNDLAASVTVDGGDFQVVGDLALGIRGLFDSTLTVDSGTVSVGGNLYIGGDLTNAAADPASVAAINVNGGALDISGTIWNGDVPNDQSSLSVTLTDGVLSADVIRGFATGTQTFDLNGGVLAARAIINSSASTTNWNINLNGATIRSLDTNNNADLIRADNGGINFKVLGNGGTLDSNGQFNQRISAPITGSAGGDLVITGGGSIVFAGDNTYDGDTTIDAGTALILGHGGTTGTLGSGSLIITDDTCTLGFGHSDDLVQSTSPATAQIAAGLATGNLEQKGPGTLTLDVANTYTGATTVSGGCLILGQAAAIPASGVGTTVAAGAGFGFDPAGLTDGEIAAIVSNVIWDATSDLVFTVNSPNTEAVSADLSSFGSDTIVLKGDGTLDLSGATLPAGVTLETPDGGTIDTGAGTDITVESITIGPGSISGKKVTIAFTAGGNVDAYASDTLQSGTWSLVASGISSSPADAEDNVAAAARFYVLVPEGSGNPYP